MANSRVVSTQAIPPPARKDGDGKEIGNLILLALPRQERTLLFPSLEFVRLKLHQVMHEAGEVIRSAYFMNSGMGSVLTVLPDGKSIEVGLIGKEGFVGLPIIFGFKTSALRVVTQADGTAYRVDVATLRKVLPGCPELAFCTASADSIRIVLIARFSSVWFSVIVGKFFSVQSRISILAFPLV